MSESFESVLERTGSLAYTNVGTSMLPFIRQGRDVMLIRRKGEERCKRLDAVLFRRPKASGDDAYVLHRVLRVKRDGTYWIVGDNCFRGEIVPEERIIGILYAIVRDGKFIGIGNLHYCVMVHVLCDLWPVRFALLWLRSLVARIFGKIRRVFRSLFR